MSAERVLEARCTSNRVEVDPRRVGSDVFFGGYRYVSYEVQLEINGDIMWAYIYMYIW